MIRYHVTIAEYDGQAAEALAHECGTVVSMVPNGQSGLALIDVPEEHQGAFEATLADDQRVVGYRVIGRFRFRQEATK